MKQASIDNKKKAIKVSREKRSKLDEKWKKLDEEEYGEDAILKKLLAKQVAMKNAVVENSKTTGSKD